MNQHKVSQYEDFLLTEYNNIAQAHFNTANTISSFFKHYLLIVSLPVPLILLMSRSPTYSPYLLAPKYALIVPIASTLISIVGFFVMNYIINLRLDAILYARTVNGIRKYFSSRSGLHLEEELRIRVLPRSIHLPHYLEWGYFFFVVLAFLFLDATYLICGWWWYTKYISWSSPWFLWPGVFVFFSLMHLASYLGLAKFRDARYLRSFRIGLDIDGVLGRHREQFCNFLRQLRGKKLDPAKITHIPVNECQDLNVTESDEHAVFNHPNYWKDMPVVEGVADCLQRLKNMFQYKIMIFTHRPWPHTTTFPEDRTDEYASLWRSEYPIWRRRPNIAMKRITKKWLKKHNIVYDKLLVEKGNIHTTDPRLRVRNRFIVSQKKNIRIFVEDDLFKATKLADSCEVVFLLDHPYNKTSEHVLPNNVIRVYSWKDIYDYIRTSL